MKETLRKAVQPFSFIWRAIALTLVICATTSAWAYSVGDTVEWSNTNTANAVSSTIYNECNFDFCIPATADLPAGSIVRIKSIKLASLNTSYVAFDATDHDSDPYSVVLNGVRSDNINGAGTYSAANAGTYLSADKKIASNNATSDYAEEFTFSSNCDIFVGRIYKAESGNSYGGTGSGLALCHNNGNLSFGSSTDQCAVRYVQSTDANSILTPYPSTSSTGAKGNGKAATDSGYYPVYEIKAEVVSIADSMTPAFEYITTAGSVSAVDRSGKWSNSFSGDTLNEYRVGAGGSGLVCNVGISGTPPYSGMAAKVSPFSFAIYADVSKVPSSTTKTVIVDFGKSSVNKLLLYRLGDNLQLGFFDGSNNELGTHAILPVPAAGFHLIAGVCDTSTGTVTLYVDSDSNTKTRGEETLLGDGFQLSSIHSSNSGFAKGTGFALSKFIGYDRALTGEEIATLISSYPATDGSVITGNIDNGDLGGTVTVYTSATNGTTKCYLGNSSGTLTVPAENVVKVTQVKMKNTSANVTATMNIAGQVIVTSESSVANVYNKRDDYEGILFGHWNGTSVVNITGALIGENAYCEPGYSSTTTVNIDGGRFKIRGLYANKANGTINLYGSGTFEVSQTMNEGAVITRNFRLGTYKANGNFTDDRAINFSATDGNATTLDPNGYSMTFGSNALTGSGNIRVCSSVAGEGEKGTVVFNDITTSYTGAITIVGGSKATLKAGAYAGTITVEEGATLEIDPGAGNTYACAASFAGAGDVIVKSGTVSFSGSNTLTKGIQVDDGAVVTATTGSEGKISVLNGGTLKLTVASNNEIWYDGYVAADVTTTGTGAVEYYDVGGTKIVDGVYPDPNTSEATTGHFNGLNLLPYYYVWDPTRATSGSKTLSNTDLWRAGIVPGDGTNVAIYVSGATTINVDVDKFFGEVQVYGSGSPFDNLVINGTGTITTPKLNVGAVTYINGQSVDATDTIRNNVGMAITGTFECNAAIVGSGDVYVGDSATTSATETDVTFKKKNTGMSGDLYVMNKAVAKTTKTDGEEGTGFGPYGGSITVCTGGQLDLANTSGVCYDITIEQGVSSETPAIVNTGDAMTGDHRQTTSLTVNADATIRCDSNHGWGLVGSSRGATSLTFKKGVTLTKVGGGNFYMCSTTVSNTGTGDAPKFVIAEGALETVSAGTATENVLADGASLDITINSGATFNGNKSIAASTFTVDGTANIGSSATLTATSLVVNKTVNVASTGVISATAVSGGGTVNWTGKQPDGNKWNTCASWTGTNVVMSTATTAITKLRPDQWGREGSYIVMKNLKGYIDTGWVSDTNPISAKVIFENGDNDYALALSDGYGGYKTYFREIAGNGTIKDINARGDNGASQLFIFRNATAFKGSILREKVANKYYNKQFIFAGTGDIWPDAQTGKVTVDASGSAVIGAGKEWSVQSGTVIAGTVTLEGAATIDSGVTISGSAARINLAGTALTINSTLTATDATWTIGGTLPGTPTKSTTVTLITGLTAEPTLGTVTVAGLSDQHIVYAVEDSGTYNVVVRLKNDEWNSDSATEWTTTSFNGSSDYSDGINVYFGAIDAVAAKTVTISGTVSPANVTFRAGASTTYTLTGGAFSPSGTVAVESGTVVIESEMTAGAITVADGATLSLTNATVASINSGVSPAVGTLNIPAGGVVTITSSSALDGIKYLTGEGTLVVGANIPSAALRTLLTKVNENDSSTHYWKGTLAFVGLTNNSDTNDFQFELYGTADSKIKLTNCAISYLKNNNTTFYGCLILNDDESHNGALRTANGYSSNYNDIGELAGNGNMVFTGGPLQLCRFHTASNYTGSISISGGWDSKNTKYDGRRIVFGTSPDTVDNYSKPASITVDAGVEAGLGEGATWNAAYGIFISGTLIVNGDANLTSTGDMTDHENAINVLNPNHIVFNSGSVLKYKKSAMITLTGDVTWPTGDNRVTLNIAELPAETIKVPLIKRASGTIDNFGASTVTVVPPTGSPYGVARWTTYTEDDGGDTIYGVVVKPGTIFSVY